MLSFEIATKTMNPTRQLIIMAVTLNIEATELNYVMFIWWPNAMSGHGRQICDFSKGPHLTFKA